MNRNTVSSPARRAAQETSYEDERQFLDEAAGLALRHIALERFRLSDWFPRAPGVYWSDRGQSTRQMVFNDEVTNEDRGLGRYYRPQAKSALIEDGGIGTIRLRPRRIDGVDCWLACAISGEQCAGGIPLALPHDVLHMANVAWGDMVRLRGQVRYLQDADLPDVASQVHHATPIILFVDEIEGLTRKRQDSGQLIITPVVLFDTDSAEDRRYNEQYSYTFVQCSGHSSGDISVAADWMARYASKFSGRIITNFDETYPLLADAPLSYQRLLKGTYDRTVIENFHLTGDFRANRIDIGQTMSIAVNLGDGNVFHGDFVVANSIKESFNRVQAVNGSADVKKLLEQLSSQVGTALKDMPPEVAQKAADDLETLTKELARPSPRKQWWELSISGIQDPAKAIKTAGKPIIETVTLLLPLLSGVGSS